MDKASNTTLQSNPHIAMPRLKKDITERRGDEPTSPVLGKNWQHRQPQIQGVPVGQKSRKQLQRLAPQRVNKMLLPRGKRSSSGLCMSIKRNQMKGNIPFLLLPPPGRWRNHLLWPPQLLGHWSGNNDNDDWFDGLEEEKPNVGGEEGRV